MNLRSAGEHEASAGFRDGDVRDLRGGESILHILRQVCGAGVRGRARFRDVHGDTRAAINGDKQAGICGKATARSGRARSRELSRRVAGVEAEHFQISQRGDEREARRRLSIHGGDLQEIVGRIRLPVAARIHGRRDRSRRAPCGGERCIERARHVAERAVGAGGDGDFFRCAGLARDGHELHVRAERHRLRLIRQDDLRALHLRAERLCEGEAEVECVANIYVVEERNLDVEKVRIAELAREIPRHDDEIEQLLWPHFTDVEELIEVRRIHINTRGNPDDVGRRDVYLG